LVVIGSVALSLAMLFNYYYEGRRYILGTYYVYPYEKYALPSGIIGVVLLTVGIIFMVAKVERERKTYLPPLPPTPSVTQKKYCRYCGSENKSDASYCEKCGKPLG
jgi:hypothetical protein